MLDFITENKITIFKVMYGIAISSLFFWFLSREDKADSLQDLEVKSLNGIILAIEAKTRGNYRVYIIDKIRSDTMYYNLYGDYFFNKQNKQYGEVV